MGSWPLAPLYTRPFTHWEADIFCHLKGKYHMVGSSSKKHVVLVLYFVHTRTHIEIQASTKALI